MDADEEISSRRGHRAGRWLIVAGIAAIGAGCQSDDEGNDQQVCSIDEDCEAGLGCDIALGLCWDDRWHPRPDASLPSSDPDAGVSPLGPATVDGLPCDEEGALVCGMPATRDANNVILLCEDGTYANVASCEGDSPCNSVRGHRSVSCGVDEPRIRFASTGSPCEAAEDTACSFDRDNVLWCTDNRWEVAVHCSPLACEARLKESGQVATACVDNAHTVGDRCTFAEALVVCSADGGALLNCVEARAVIFQACSEGTTCQRVTHETGPDELGCVAAGDAPPSQ